MQIPNAIEFVFENCEVAEIPFSYIKTIQLGGITTTKTIGRDYKGEWHTSTKNVATRAFIQFEKDFDDCVIETNFGSRLPDRLRRYSDIVHVGYLFPDHNENILIEWDDPSGFDNPNQKHYRFPGSGLVIEVKPTVH